MTSKKTFGLLIMIFISSMVIAQHEIRFIDGSLAAVMKIAKERNKNVFIDTYADWCVPCKRMEEKFKNKEVADFFNEHFINYRVNMQNPQRAADIRRRYDVVFLPTMYILDPNGIVKYQVDRELSVAELLNVAEEALDPNSYFVSDATAVNRKDGTKTGGRRPNGGKPTSSNKKSETHATADEKATDPQQKAIDPTTGNVSISAATRRAKILESYETVEGSSQKVLAVLGEGELPPEILLQEAYLRLEFMDGSSNAAAQKYLATQSDWNTDTNRKFILDFLNSTFTEEYQFLLDHKSDFITQFGEAKVNRSLEVLTYRTLHNAVPRPTLDEAIVLYRNLEHEASKKRGYHYYINRLITEDNTEAVLEISDAYLSSEKNDHEMMYSVARYLSNTKNNNETELKKAANLLESAIQIIPKNLIYLELLASTYINQDKPKKARGILQNAIKFAKEEGQEFNRYEAQLYRLESY